MEQDKRHILQSGLLSERRVQWRLPCQLQRFAFVRMHFYWFMAVDYNPSVKVKFLRPLRERGDLRQPKPVSNDRGRQKYIVSFKHRVNVKFPFLCWMSHGRDFNWFNNAFILRFSRCS